MILSRHSHSKIEPSWLAQLPAILYTNGLIVLELRKTFWIEKSEMINP
jgi:hypothetical protein